jgi:hypothetical protein
MSRVLVIDDDLGTRVSLTRFGGRFNYAASVARRSNAAGRICPSVECRRRWL